MNNNIRDLLMSENKDDVALGLIIAHKEGIPVKEIDELFDSLPDIETISRHIYFKYLHLRGAVFQSWREEMFI